ncbi:Daunorubicin/doxorubicin resistance ABC transporter permease protein DrrB [Agromyces sp. NDB4Y10]|uniref:ABC transporter permease n=1 Tax=Agromyces sp. NDB4Y10 TaxID=1775951 RepID=UPI0007B309D8|nr:ABC transporter permease [Agromyces sp. NDB4Y10]KZE94217.1 Daunorubicin/doxorubicin resistance ABC transporter permease protein DrrB [Agromyces sp. NDB4Y10]
MTTTAAVAVRGRPSGPTAEIVFIRRSLTHSLRDTEALLMAVILPTMLMLLFTYVFGGALDPTGGYVDYVVPGIILLCAGFGASSTALYVSRDMTTGIIDRFRTMPLRASAVLTGHVVASVLRNLVATGVVIGVAIAVGFRPTASPVEWLAAVGLVALYILAITTLFAAIGLAASSPEAASAYGFILLFLPYLSSAFVPVETLPAWLAWFAEHQPITPVIEAIRSLLMDTPAGEASWWAIGWCILVIAVAAVWGSWLFRHRAGRD